MENTLQFQSTVSVFLTYLILKTAPLVAVVYYFFTWQWALLSALILLVIILIHSARTNHNFSISDKSLSVTSSISFRQQKHIFNYTDIKYIELKYAREKDNHQWLGISLKETDTALRFRCDWLHLQDPPDEDEDDHGHPEHELFELLEDEDFYAGSLQELRDQLQQKGVIVHEV